MRTPDPDATFLRRVAQRSCELSERWFPDPYIFAVLAVGIVAAAALAIGSEPTAVVREFGNGFWSLIPFTLQMSFIIIGGYVTADSPPVEKLVTRLAALPRTGRGAVAFVATFSMLVSLIHWGLSLILGSLLVRALARRESLHMDYRAAGAAAYLGLGATWAMGLSSSAAQLQANPASMPPSLLAISGVIPFSETILLWQSVALTAVLVVVSTWIAWATAPSPSRTKTAADLGVAAEQRKYDLPPRTRPGDWLEYSPLLNVFLALLGAGWLAMEVAGKGAITAVANLNTYNLIFLVLGLLLQWRPRRFLDAVSRAVPGVAGVLIQFPLYGAAATILTGATDANGVSLVTVLTQAFSQITTSGTYAWVMGGYSALVGMFIPSGGGKWLIEAPYVMQTAVDLQYPLGWAVQIYNAAEALPNLINPFWMLPLLGVLGLKARDLIGFSFLQFVVHVPLVLTLLWLLGMTVDYHPPVLP
jgi:short-chain fatty acids transporter